MERKRLVSGLAIPRPTRRRGVCDCLHSGLGLFPSHYWEPVAAIEVCGETSGYLKRPNLLYSTFLGTWPFRLRNWLPVETRVETSKQTTGCQGAWRLIGASMKQRCCRVRPGLLGYRHVGEDSQNQQQALRRLGRLASRAIQPYSHTPREGMSTTVAGHKDQNDQRLPVFRYLMLSPWSTRMAQGKRRRYKQKPW